MTEEITTMAPITDVPLAERLKLLRANIDYFSSVLKCDNLDASCAARYKDMRNAEIQRYVKEVHFASIIRIKRKQKDGKKYYLWATHIGKKRITAVDRDVLYEKLYDYYTRGTIDKSKATLSDMFSDFLRDKAFYVSGKSVKEYKRIWEKYYEGSYIAKTALITLRAKDYRRHFVEICHKYQLSKKRFMHVKSVLSGLLSYCVEEEIIVYNPIRDMNYRKFPYADDPSYNHVKAKPFTMEQTLAFRDWCMEELKKPNIKKIYIYALLFNISIGLRFAELAGLRWEDIDFQNNLMTVSGQAVLQIEMKDDLTFQNHGRGRVEHMKSHEEPRIIPLLPEEMDILLLIRDLKLSSTYVFPQGDFRYHTYNDKVKKAASDIGLDPTQYHTHCLRATAATNTYNSCQDVRQVQLLLGHTTPEMTNRYIHNNRGIEVLRTARGAVEKNLSALKCSALPSSDSEKKIRENL